MDNTARSKCQPLSDTSSWNPDNNEYNRKVDQRLAEDSTEVFGNFSYENAQYIISRFVETAAESVTIFAGSIPGDFYGKSLGPDGIPFYKAIEKASQNIVTKKKQRNASAESSIRIITIDGKRDTDLVRFAETTNMKYGVPVIKIFQTRYTGQAKLKHYLVVDHKRYRLEEYHESFGDKTPAILKAEVCCNNPNKSAIMENSFDQLWSMLSSQNNKSEE